MTTATKHETHERDTYMHNVDERMAHWRQELNRLEQEIENFSDEAQAKFQKELAELKLNWQQVEAKFSTLKPADEDNWESERTHWEETANAYQRSFYKTADRMREIVPLGWLQGFTDVRTLDSEGWAQGQGHRPEGSEGWAEGMGHQEKDGSKGWAEGYDKVNQS